MEGAPKRQRRDSRSLVPLPLPLLRSQLVLPEPILVLQTVLVTAVRGIRFEFRDVLRNLGAARHLLQCAMNSEIVDHGGRVPPGETITFQFAWPTDSAWGLTSVDSTVPPVAVRLASHVDTEGKFKFLLHHDLGNGYVVDTIVSVDAVIDMLQQVTRQMLEKARQRQAIAQEVHEAVDSSDLRSLVGSYLPYFTNGRRRLSTARPVHH